tara:strand:- start:4828 stop:5007 length:180 start_codon:yes stop_codon:yes gene_type:complete
MIEIFDACVALLYTMAEFFGMTYKAINVWIFCIIEPIIFIYVLLRLIYWKRKYKLGMSD